MADHTGVSFNGVHSWDDWGLRLKDISIGIPEAKTEYIDVPGMNGSLDLTEAQNGGICYGMRTLQFTFDARNCSYVRWAALISLIAGAIEGQDEKIILDIDSGYYYTGRCHVSTSKSNSVLSEIVIECYCQPFKMDVNTSDEPWLWDPFSFVDGMATSTSDISISSASAWQAVEINGYMYNETLVIVSNNSMTVRYNGTEYAITEGSNYMYEIVLTEGINTLYFMGTGTVTIIHRGGRI
ncbi:MAG: phage tail family protein [Bacteroidales bacterium]|nr:phage tail family protein [Bacteroidales bacterium]